MGLCEELREELEAVEARHKAVLRRLGEWQAIGVIGGLLIGAAGFAFNAWLGWRRDQREGGGR